MTRVRTVLGLIAGAILVLSSAAHSFLGWKALQARLVTAQAPSDLIQGLAIGWHFAGAAMLAFGIIVLAIFAKRLRGEVVSSLPALSGWPAPSSVCLPSGRRHTRCSDGGRRRARPPGSGTGCRTSPCGGPACD